MPAPAHLAADSPQPPRITGNAAWVDQAGHCLPRRETPLILTPRPQAGFPSPAADYIEDGIDLNTWLVSNPPATFFIRIQGDSMIDLGMLDGDVVAVDRSKEPRAGKVVIAAYDGNFYVKKLRRMGGRLALCSENAAKATAYPPMFLDEAQDHTIWGVVTGVVRKV